MTNKTVYIVGYNMPGYLASMEPYECETWEEARDAMVAELRHHADSFLASGPEDSDVDDMVTLDYRANQLEMVLSPGGGWSETIGGIEYWIHLEVREV